MWFRLKINKGELVRKRLSLNAYIQKLQIFDKARQKRNFKEKILGAPNNNFQLKKHMKSRSDDAEIFGLRTALTQLKFGNCHFCLRKNFCTERTVAFLVQFQSDCSRIESRYYT